MRWVDLIARVVRPKTVKADGGTSPSCVGRQSACSVPCSRPRCPPVSPSSPALNCAWPPRPRPPRMLPPPWLPPSPPRPDPSSSPSLLLLPFPAAICTFFSLFRCLFCALVPGCVSVLQTLGLWFGPIVEVLEHSDPLRSFPFPPLPTPPLPCCCASLPQI